MGVGGQGHGKFFEAALCLAPVKREAGGSPARTRRCNRGVLLCRKVSLTENVIVFGKRKQGEDT